MAQEEKTPTERLLERKRRRDQGVRMQQFLEGEFYKEEILPLIERQKHNALLQANQQLPIPGSTHAMLAACVSWHFAFDTMKNMLEEIAGDASLEVTDAEPESEGPDVTQ